MTLRPIHHAHPARLGALAAAVALVLAVFAGSASAGAGDYPSPLYLSGGASSQIGTSFQLVATAPPSTPATPTAAASGVGVLVGSYTYLYTVDTGSGSVQASATSNSPTAAIQAITVSGLPTTGATVDVYRQKSATGVFSRVAHLVANASATFYDNVSDATAAAAPSLPQADNRVATTFSAVCGATTCGYVDFSPGIAPATTVVTAPPTLAAAPSATPNNKGWIVDGSGGVTIPAGSWTFTARTKSGASLNGTAHLVVGVWKVTTSGGVVASSTAILDPTCTGVGVPAASCPGSAENGTNLVTAAATVQTISHTVSLPLISLAAGEHLYVQYWRRQTGSYTNGGGGPHLITMVAFDGMAQITHPAASSFPNTPVLQTPAASARANSPTLTAAFSDPDAGDTGTVAFQLCSDAACSSLVASGSSGSVANGANASWTPGGVADGAYYWRARATDAAGGQSAWTATSAFTLDRTAPSTPTLQTPANTAVINALPALAALFSDPDAGDTGALSFRICTDAGCTAVARSGTASGLASGATGTWTPASLADGAYYWQALAADAAGNQSSWSGARSFTLDTTPPDTTLGSGPANPATTGTAAFTFTATEAGSTFQCSLDGAAYGACTGPKSYSGLADGSHTFLVRATDAAGNVDPTPASSTWTIDTTPPDTTISSGPASASNTSAPAFGFTSTEAGSTFQCSLDGAAYGACTSPKSYAGLADGSHTFLVKATDAAGNVDPTPASSTWTIDTVAPNTTIGSSPSGLTATATATVTFASTETGSTFQCSLDAAAYAACTSPLTTSALADGAHTFLVRATDAAGNTDATPASASWTVDATRPTASIATGPAASTNSTSATFSFSGADNATPVGSLAFQCKLDAGAASACTSPKTTSGLASGSHTFTVTATDLAGNVSVAATSSWSIDTAAPETTIDSSPPRLTNASSASFGFSSSKAGSTIACSLDGQTYAGCTSPAAFSGLADGSHTFQAWATDSLGNTDATPAKYSWTIDTAPPFAPAPSAPADRALVNAAARLSAVFSDPNGTTGTIAFRLCHDPECAFSLAGGSSATVLKGATAEWAIGTALPDGVYYWQARAQDAAGNQSSWTATRSFTIDTVAPAAPGAFAGTFAGGALTLRWSAPDGESAVRSYVVYADGKRLLTVDGGILEATLGKLGADDGRAFAVAAVDAAGNEGARTETLTAVPDLIGLKLDEANAALDARGMTIGGQTKAAAAAVPMIVVSQTPAAPALVAPNTPVTVVIANPAAAARAGTKLVALASTSAVSCSPSGRLSVTLKLSASATVVLRFLDAHGLTVSSQLLGPVRAGATKLALRLPSTLRQQQQYRLVLTAIGKRAQVARTELSLSVARSNTATLDAATACRSR